MHHMKLHYLILLPTSNSSPVFLTVRLLVSIDPSTMYVAKYITTSNRVSTLSGIYPYTHSP